MTKPPPRECAVELGPVELAGPVVGAPWQLDGGLAPATAGALLVSAPPARAVALGGDCFAAVHPTAAAVLTALPSTATWRTTVPLPNAIALLGLRVSVQAVFGPTAGPLGADLSNGLQATLGR